MKRWLPLLALVACGPTVPPAHFEVCAASDAPLQTDRVWTPTGARVIADENQRPGAASWDAGADGRGRIDGYADHVSAHAGETVQLMVDSAGHDFVWRVYRLGWYGGDGARLMLDGGRGHVAAQPRCPVAPDSGAVRCAWSPSLHFVVDDGWRSGLYLVRLERDDGVRTLVPLVITDDRPSDLLLQIPVTTWQAYNGWGGTSLYNDETGTLPNGRAVAVSFDRPYADGAGRMLDNTRELARFLERFGYDVSYTTNLDVAVGGPLLLYNHGAFISVGHDEYWPRAERDAVESARNLGVPLLFFGANIGYWQVRLGDDAHPRDFVCYKAGGDPVTGNDTTGRFRDDAILRPEDGLVGVMYEDWLLYNFPLVVEDPTHFVFAGTNLAQGDALPQLVGYEYDRIDSDCAPSTRSAFARSPVATWSGRPRVAEGISYRASSNALVFAAGTINWSLALGKPGYEDARVERMTANVLHEALGLAIPAGVGVGVSYAPQIQHDGGLRVSTLARELRGLTAVAALADGSYAVLDAESNSLWAIQPGDNGMIVWRQRLASTRGGAGGLSALATDDAGRIYFSETEHHCIRRLDEHGAVSTFAGLCGRTGFSNGPPAQARLASPMGVAVDRPQHRLLFADADNHRVRAVDLETRVVSTVVGDVIGAGDGNTASAGLRRPTSVAVAPSGAVYVVDAGNQSRILVVTPDHAVTTIVSGGTGYLDGAGDEARLGAQAGLVWLHGGLLVADSTNYVLRRVVPGSDAASTRVTTFAGSGRSSAVDGPTARAGFVLPLGLALARDGSVLVADGGAGALRVIH